MDTSLARLFLIPVTVLISLLLFALEARAQHTGGSFGGSAWGTPTRSAPAARTEPSRTSRPVSVRRERSGPAPSARPTPLARTSWAPSSTTVTVRMDDSDDSDEGPAQDAPETDLKDVPGWVLVLCLLVLLGLLVPFFRSHRRSRDWRRF